MADTKNAMRTPLGRVRHHGAGGAGTGHFIAQRVTSIALALLAPWFVVSAALSFKGGNYLGVIDFLTQPANAVGVVLLLAAGFYHMHIGMQEVILDYIQRPFTKILLLVLNTFALFALGAGAVFAVLMVNFGV
jgi:succinate dehydrogenase / fumarate reductase membrane anchor subunit